MKKFEEFEGKTIKSITQNDDGNNSYFIIKFTDGTKMNIVGYISNDDKKVNLTSKTYESSKPKTFIEENIQDYMKKLVKLDESFINITVNIDKDFNATVDQTAGDDEAVAGVPAEIEKTSGEEYSFDDDDYDPDTDYDDDDDELEITKSETEFDDDDDDDVEDGESEVEFDDDEDYDSDTDYDEDEEDDDISEDEDENVHNPHRYEDDEDDLEDDDIEDDDDVDDDFEEDKDFDEIDAEASTMPAEVDDVDDVDDDEVEVTSDDIQVKLNNQLMSPEFSREEYEFKDKNGNDYSGIVLAKLAGGFYLFKTIDGVKKIHYDNVYED